MADNRQDVLDLLIEQGIIDAEDAAIIIDISQPEDDTGLILDYVAGQLDVPTGVLSRAVEGTEYAVAQADITPTKESVGQWWADSWFKKAWDTWNSDELLEPGPVPGTAELIEDLNRRIDQMRGTELSEKEADQLQQDLYQGFGTNKILEVAEEVMRRADAANIDLSTTSTLVQTYTQNRQEREDPEGEQEMDDLVRMYAERAGPTPSEISTAISPQTATAPDSFEGWLAYAGFGDPEQVQLTDPLERLAGLPQLGGTGPNQLYDPLTGGYFTNDQYRTFQALPEGSPEKQAYSTLPATSQLGRAMRMFDKGLLPAEDLVIPTALPSGPYQQPLYNWTRGDAFRTWRNMSPELRRSTTRIMIDQNLIPDKVVSHLNENGEGWMSDAMGVAQLAVWEQALGQSRDWQMDPIAMLFPLGEFYETQRALQTRGGGSRRQPYTVPLSLRTIPDYESLSQSVRNQAERELGRKMEPYEVQLMADKLKGHHTERNATMIQADRDRWNAAMAGRPEDVPEMVEVPEPSLRLQKDIQDDYAAEISRLERTEDRARSRQLMVGAITKGTGMLR